jgi:hypothetical protein
MILSFQDLLIPVINAVSDRRLRISFTVYINKTSEDISMLFVDMCEALYD